LSFSAVINVLLNFLLIPRFSYTAAAFVSVITELVVVILAAYMVARKLNYVPLTENFLRILGAGGLMGVFLFFFKNLNFFVLAISSAVLYFIFLWLFRAIEKSEITSIISKKEIQEYEEVS